MYYTSRMIKLTTRLNSYLELIQEANNRYEDKRSDNNRWKEKDSSWFYFNYSFNERYMARMKVLSFWLCSRMQFVLIEINKINIKQSQKELDLLNNETANMNL